MPEKLKPFPPVLYNLTPFNEVASKVSIRMFHKGYNRNFSYISDEAGMLMAKSALGTAIVGNYSEEEEGFLEHSLEWITKEDGLDAKHRTTPFGFVPLDSEI